ncbi:hypothetical protein EYF80_031755 [Liparis tanakae]|uniref:Uncharacterized protein n=1 Tax=Liparis tanakae TaxID=230148 RepID=A0A4Z2GWH6_9TELE|nr:hypothetical protein EYF80_031755 [Liparis tanakae]
MASQMLFLMAGKMELSAWILTHHVDAKVLESLTKQRPAAENLPVGKEGSRHIALCLDERPTLQSGLKGETSTKHQTSTLPLVAEGGRDGVESTLNGEERLLIQRDGE